jgi:hypothetical protein
MLLTGSACTGQRTRVTHLPRTHNSTAAAATPAQYPAGDPPAVATVRPAVAEGEGASGASAVAFRGGFGNRGSPRGRAGPRF